MSSEKGLTQAVGNPLMRVLPLRGNTTSLLTYFQDGAGLACGIFEYFLSLGIQRPKVLGATHFHEIFENGFLQPRPSLTYGSMEVRLDREAEELENQVTYLYKYELRCHVRTLLTIQAAADLAEAVLVMAAGEMLPSFMDLFANLRQVVRL